MAAKVQWTEAQQRGITTTGRSLLVSAAAGSGKTAILAERCAHLISTGECDVDELLVVTFTEAAAAEMKSRIHAALRDRAAEKDSARLNRQLAQIDRAQVSTIHSFCATLLREHFHSVGLDPSFNVLDGEEASLLRREIARMLFDERYERDTSGDFHRFIDAYGEGEDSQLIGRVIRTHEMLTSLIDPEAWIQRSRELVAEASEGELTGSRLGEDLVRLLSGMIVETRRQCQRSSDLVERFKNFPAYEAALSECGKTLRYWDELLKEHGIDALAEHVQDLKHPRLTAVSSAVPNKDVAKQAVDAVREAMTGGPLRDLLRFTSEQWQQGLAAIRPHTDVFLDLVIDFGKAYAKAKEAARVVDFADLERFALQVLSERSDGKLFPSRAARACHKHFAHVLVDEYQDINEIQDAILALVSRECVSDDGIRAGNLFCVGDVKQSIYRFRLAEAGRFLERQKRFRKDKQRRGEVIDLQSNFRSRAPLLASINSVFERLMCADAVDIEYDQSHRLHAGLSYPALGGASFSGAPIEMHLLPADLASEEPADSTGDDVDLDRSEREALLVAQRIHQLLGRDGAATMQVMEKQGSQLVQRPLRFSDIVILLRSMQYKSQQYADILRRAGIPVHAQSGTGYFESMEVRDMLSLLALLDNQRQDIPLAAVLRSPLANLPEPENCFARIRLAYPAHGKDALAFHEAVASYADDEDKDDELRAALRDFLSQLARWRRMAHSRPLAEVITDIYHTTGYLAFCSGLHDGEQRVANLQDLHHRAAQFGGFRRQGLSRFMQFLQSLQEETDLGQPSIASEADDVVRVMSIHRSKGQEFPVVIVPDLGKRINLSDCHGSIVADRTAGLGLAVVDDHRMIRYPSLAQVLVQRRLKQQALAEEMRVLYVAMTRAREHLMLIGTCKDATADGWAQRWTAHEGFFPPDAILGARTMLDWLGPAAVACGEGIIRATRHSSDEVLSWQTTYAKRPELSERQRELARLQPLVNIASSATADEVVKRLEFSYPFNAFTRLPAAGAVTKYDAREGEASAEPAVVEIDGSGGGSPSLARLSAPLFMADYAASPADIGTATHLVLQHLDFQRTDNLDAQLQEMIDRKRITSAEAKLVDMSTIEWFVSTETAALIGSNSRRLRRELPIYFAIGPPGLESPDPQDRVMIRGRIDLLICADEGGIIIDYKTDRMSGEEVPQRAAEYVSQMEHYRHAVTKITGVPVSEVRLVFLAPRIVHRLVVRRDCF